MVRRVDARKMGKSRKGKAKRIEELGNKIEAIMVEMKFASKESQNLELMV